MERARQIIKDVLAKAKSPAVLMSFGKDSMLLLQLVREVAPETPCIWFHQGQTGEQDRFAKRIILEWDLEVWSWLASDVYLIPSSEGLTLIREQSFGHNRFPVLMDVEDGQGCVFDFPKERTPVLYPHFDALFIGYKDSDYHSVLGSGFCPADGWELGRAKVYAPLRAMRDGEVWDAIRELSVPYDEERYDNHASDPDSLHACTRCLQAGEGEVWCPKEEKDIPRVAWQPEEGLRAFQERFGFRRAA